MTVRTVTKQSESYFKVGVLGVWSNLFNFGFPDITSEGIIEVTDASVNIIRGALDDHFDSAVQDIADEAGQAVTMGDVVSGKAEANALDPANKDNMFCDLAHYLRCRYHITYQSGKSLLFIIMQDYLYIKSRAGQ
jgi:hypothetical protein